MEGWVYEKKKEKKNGDCWNEEVVRKTSYNFKQIGWAQLI